MEKKAQIADCKEIKRLPHEREREGDVSLDHGPLFLHTTAKEGLLYLWKTRMHVERREIICDIKREVILKSVIRSS